MKKKSVYYCLTVLIFAFSVLLTQCGLPANDELVVAAREGRMHKVQELLAAGANVNHRLEQVPAGHTAQDQPIIAAATSGQTEIVKLLLEKGANVNAQNTEDYENALHRAIKNKHDETIDVLLKAGIDPNLETINGIDPLLLAVEQDNFPLIQKLVKYGAYPDTTRTSSDINADHFQMGVIQYARSLNRSYSGYLQQIQNYCLQKVKTDLTCKRF